MKKHNWLTIRYRDFYDIPRAFLVDFEAATYYFDCAFDEDADDYPTVFKVYEIDRGILQALEPGSWVRLSDRGRYITDVSTSNVVFDHTRRQYIDAAVIQDILTDRE